MSSSTGSGGFSEAERAAMKERARELKAQGRSGQKKADNEKAALDAIAEMPDDDRVLAERIHTLVMANAPELQPKTWYGMPAYANTEGKVICFYKAAAKFDGRYAVLGFEDSAMLDDGPMWPVVFAIVEWTPAVEQKLVALVKAAVA
ncbi:MAG: iron chaperone [Acidimicrobiia bacterium]